MIRAEFYGSKGLLVGFAISGHSGYAERGSDIVCAAVSSAVQLTVNLLEGFGASPEVEVGEDLIKCKAARVQNASLLLENLRAHLGSILEEYPNTIKITNSEV